MKINKVITKAIITEKSIKDIDSENKYHFKVARNASKGGIAFAVESLFDVNVVKVKTMIMPGKPKKVFKSKSNRMIKTPRWKKAIVQIQDGQKIKFVTESK